MMAKAAGINTRIKKIEMRTKIMMSFQEIPDAMRKKLTRRYPLMKSLTRRCSL
jgi:hypothetical protein